MTFAGLNFLAIVIAAVAAWLVGAVWYMSLGKIWTAARGLTPEKMPERRAKPGAFLPFIYCFVAELIMAWVLAGLRAPRQRTGEAHQRYRLGGVLLARIRGYHGFRERQLRDARHAVGMD
jgi:hypothetical protein